MFDLLGAEFRVLLTWLYRQAGGEWKGSWGIVRAPLVWRHKFSTAGLVGVEPPGVQLGPCALLYLPSLMPGLLSYKRSLEQGVSVNQ